MKVHYEGRLLDGTIFDSSRKRGEPATLPLNGVIGCWTEAFGRMKVGERAVLTCPSEIAYGEAGRPPEIPGGATLVFDVELLGDRKGRASVAVATGHLGDKESPRAINSSRKHDPSKRESTSTRERQRNFR